jgi:hypothetical protein
VKNVILLLAILVTLSVGSYFLIQRDSTVVKCKESQTATPYCMYKGKVKSVYVNENGLILIGIYETIDKTQASSVGFELKTLNYFAYQMTGANRAFGEAILSINQTAIDGDKLVEMHARGTLNGTVKIDRIWLLND